LTDKVFHGASITDDTTEVKRRSRSKLMVIAEKDTKKPKMTLQSFLVKNKLAEGTGFW